MHVAEAISKKRAVREYAERDIPEKVIKQILKAGSRAQSSKNSQPWHYVVCRDKQSLDSLSRTGLYASHITTAAMVVVLVTETVTKNNSILFDIGQSAAFMQLAALEFGIGSCVVKFHNGEETKQLLDVPSDWEIHFGISFGYPRESELVKSPATGKGRRSISEIVHWERWKITRLKSQKSTPPETFLL